MRLKRGMVKRIVDSLSEPPAIAALKGDKAVGITLLSGRRCNFRCSMCETDSGPRRKEMAKPEMVEPIFRGLKPTLDSGRVKFITISGGEPTLNMDFVVKVAETLLETVSASSASMPFFGMITNGSARRSEVFERLAPFKDVLWILYSDDEFHRAFSKRSLSEGSGDSAIARFRKMGFRMHQMPDAEVVSLGRGFDLSGTAMVRACDGAHIAYSEKDGVVKASHIPSKRPHRMMVDEAGRLRICGHLGPLIGDLVSESTLDIVQRIRKSPDLLSLATLGPLATTKPEDAEGELRIAMEKGPCGLCHLRSADYA
ncbi:MAG: radical SAM protein [Candidatus Micrarchaeota archaeon]